MVNHILKHFFTKKDLSKKEARGIETLGRIGIIPTTLKPGKVHILGDALSRAPHAPEGSLVNDVKVPNIEFDNVITSYDEDQFFLSNVNAFKNEWPSNEKQKYKIKKLLPMFKWDRK